MDSKGKAGEALKTSCREFGVPDKLRFDGSKEQTGKKTEFQQQIRKNNIQQHVSEQDMHNQSPAEGVVREMRKKWYRIMFRKNVSKILWDYGMR
jgi:phage gp16-like protein